MRLSWAQCTVQRFGLITELSSVLCSTESCCAVVTLLHGLVGVGLGLVGVGLGLVLSCYWIKLILLFLHQS